MEEAQEKLASAISSTGTDCTTLESHADLSDERAKTLFSACIGMAQACLDKTRSSREHYVAAVRWLHAAQIFAREEPDREAIVMKTAKAYTRLSHHRAARDAWGSIASNPASPNKAEAERQVTAASTALADSIKPYVTQNQADQAAVADKLETSPLKLLKGYGDKSVAKQFGSADVTLQQAAEALPPGISDKKEKAITGVYQTVRDDPVVLAEPLEEAKRLFQPYFDSDAAVALACLSWNIKLANVTDAKGEKLSTMIQAKMNNIAKMVVEEKADVLLLQELPGALYERSGAKHCSSVKEAWVQTYLRKALTANIAQRADPVEYDMAEIAVHKWTGWPHTSANDEGEHHLFVWNKRRLTKLTEPACMSEDDSDSANTFHRAPSWMLFKDRITGDYVCFVSCHLKSGGKELTVHDTQLLGKQAQRLYEQECIDHGGDVAMVLMGDFNMSPRRVAQELRGTSFESTLPLATEHPTNMYPFTGSGSRADGKAYDGAFLAAEGWKGQATVHDAAQLLTQELAEMKEVVASVSKATSAISVDVWGELGAGEIRKRYQAAVYREWSDHVPVSLMLTKLS
eukprot:TRINITY_DN12127_c0_g4_i1.p1 TRINITY_DN12127_c0_g4~~TRINITY_DN12127_c0_g4_i1.p1  ORF type:complete len:573 (+),score=158.29 TRINITY_DN12127_c0_g4_i1:493-2211(+)